MPPYMMGTPVRGSHRNAQCDIRFTAKSLVYFQIIYVLVVLYLMSEFGLPGSMLYVTDVVTILALACCPRGSWAKFRSLGNTALLVVLALLCIVIALGDVASAVRPALVIWGVRNTFRFFGFLYVCVALLDRSDIDKVFSLFFGVQMVNLVLSLIQYSQGFSQDNLGGIFGTAVGCNGYSNVFFCILLAYYALAYADGRKGMARLLFVLASTLALAALAELKIYYIEAVLIVVFAFLCRANKVRSFVMLLILGTAFSVALQMLSEVFPGAYAMLMDVDAIMAYSTDSSGAVYGYNIGRLSAFGDINRLIFRDDLSLNLFGIGFGNAGYSSFSIFTSSFYQAYGSLNYHFFTHQTWFIETGFVGFGLFILLFLTLFSYCGKWASKIPADSFYFRLTQIVIVVTVLCFWYNQTVRVEAAYLTFFVLSIPFIIVRSNSFEGRTGSSHAPERCD